MIHNIGAWNIRGGHKNCKLDQIKKLISENQLALICLSETKLNLSQSKQASNFINPNWQYITNHSHAEYGRLLILYDPTIFTITPILHDFQFIHTHAFHCPSSTSLYITFIYASNSPSQRETLHNYLPHFTESKAFLKSIFNIALGDMCLEE